MFFVYRICKKIYNPADSSGATRIPGRWHNLGQKVLYFSSSLALCVLELRANSVSFSTIRNEFHYTRTEIDSNIFSVFEVPDSFYTKNWTLNNNLTREFGGEWYRKNSTLFLKVRSAVLPTDYNYILNAAHPDFRKIIFPKPLNIPLDTRVQ
ncbi:MAG: RES family NAD+ phosphorylase [Ignavibacteriaceae bacterium]